MKNKLLIGLSKLMPFLLLPPVAGLCYGIYRYFKHDKSIYNLVGISFCYCMCLIYSLVSYDNRLRFLTAENIFISQKEHSLTVFLSWAIDHSLFSYTFYFFLFSFVSLLFYVYFLKKTFLTVNVLVFIIMFMGITMRNLYDLTYYTLATTFVLFMMALKINKLIKWFLLIFIVYLIHPGVLMILLPSVPLSFLYKREKYRLANLYLFIIAIIGLIIYTVNWHWTLKTGFNYIDNAMATFEMYTRADYVWGALNSENISLTAMIYNAVFIIICGLLFVYSYRSVRSKIIKPEIVSLIIVAGIFYFMTFQFRTIHERIGVSLYIIAIAISPILLSHYKLLSSKKWIYLCVFIYVVSFWANNQDQSDILKRRYFDTSISMRKYYMPCVFLLDINTFGASDDYLRQNIRQ